MKLQQYILTEQQILDRIDYQFYCFMLESCLGESPMLNEGISDFFKDLKDKAVGIVKNIITDFGNEIKKLSEELKLDARLLLDAFKNKDVFNMLKAFGFNLKNILKAINTLSVFVRQGLFHVFKELHNSKIIQQLHKGTMKIDEVLDKYPILKKVGGIAVAGLLFYIWSQMTFIGNVDFDFDISHIVAALHGNYSLADLFSSPQGIMMLSLFATGSIVSVPWLGSTAMNLIMVAVYHAYKKVKNSKVDLNLIKKHFELARA